MLLMFVDFHLIIVMSFHICNPYLIPKFDCHINVEVCTTVKSVKYIHKYVYKGYDSASVKKGAQVCGQDVEIDEITNFLHGRYVGSTEAAWRIFEYSMHFQSHAIIRLDVHLPGNQRIVFRDGEENYAIENFRNTKLLAFFQLNQDDPTANQFKYTEIPTYFVWIDGRKKW